MADYTKTKSGFNLNLFECELIGSGIQGYYQGGYFIGDDITISFSQELSASEETELDDIIAAHPSLKWQLDMHLSSYRWAKEVGGILSQGYLIDTSDRSKALLDGAYLKVQADATPTATMDFKTGTGWQAITHANIELIALDVAEHVEKCFSAEKATHDKVWDGTLTTEAAVESEFETEYAAQ